MKTLVLFVAVCATAATAAAQTKISGTEICPKPAEMHMLAVGDNPNHSLMIFKSKCRWTKPLEIEGIQAQTEEATGYSDLTGNRFREQGYVVNSLANGDKAYATWQGTGIAKDGIPQNHSGKWRYTGGTGKFKGITGSGTYKGKAGADGGWTTEVEGDYALPKK